MYCLAPGQGHSRLSVKAGGWAGWEQPGWEGVGGAGGWEAGHDQATWACRQKGQMWSGLHQNQHGQQIEGGNSAPLLWDPI